MIGALILGIVAGFLGRALLPGKQSMNVVLTIVLGLAGSLLGFLACSPSSSGSATTMHSTSAAFPGR